MDERSERSARRPVAPALPRPVTARGARTRAALKRAARSLFEKQGYQDSSISQISTRARVAHGTFYTYFDSKEQVFGEIVADLFVDLERVMAQQPPAAGKALSQRIERAIHGYLVAYHDNARLLAALEQAATLSAGFAEIRRATSTVWTGRSADAIRRWQQRGEVSAHVDPQSAAEILGCMVDRTAYVRIVLHGSFDLEVTTRELTRLYCNGLGLTYFRDEKPRSRAATRRRS